MKKPRDVPSARQSVAVARNLNSDLYILVRTRFVAEIDELRKIGADEIIPEEFETSVEIFARVLYRFDVPRNVILDLVGRVRSGMYDMLRGPRRSFAGVLAPLEGVQVNKLLVRADSPAVGLTIGELGVRARSGATIVAVQRGDTPHSNPGSELRLEAGDIVLVLGDSKALDAALALLDPQTPIA